jgi:hypothetical protein
MYDTAFGLQQTMKHLQANTLGTSAHQLVQDRELPHTTESANNLAESALAYFVFDCQVVTYNIQEDCAMPRNCQFFPDQRFLPSMFVT